MAQINDVVSKPNWGEALQGSSAIESADENTTTTIQILDGLCEGPIEGWATQDPLKSIYYDGSALRDLKGQIKVGNVNIQLRKGSVSQTPLSQYNIIGAVKSPSFAGEILDINDTGGTAIIQQVQIRDDSDGAYPPIEAVAFNFLFPEGLWRQKDSGGRDSTPVSIKIELNPKKDPTAGSYVTRIFDTIDAEITSGEFEKTYIVEIPPGWLNSAPVQAAGTAAYSAATDRADDVVTFRITKCNSRYQDSKYHNKMYLKSFTLMTRNQYSMPYTAVVGQTFDSVNFDGSLPKRQFDLKLMKVKVPSNYYTFSDENGKVYRREYRGTWDGTFKAGREWTDNPAWCLYDIITENRYGLGNYIKAAHLNKWKLYEIAKYCDGVTTDPLNGTYQAMDIGYGASSGGTAFGAVTDGYGVYEPRFTCNLLLNNREEAFSVIQKIAAIFRGISFYTNGLLNINADMPSTPLTVFTNSNVVDGVFSYAGSGLKARHTVAIVKWLDPSDLYSEKLEYVEDYDGISRLGYREIEVDGIGCTSRSQAYRIGKHILVTEKFETETVTFKTGLEGSVLLPGTIVKIKDHVRQGLSNRAGGRIVSATSNSITLDNSVVIPSGALNIKLWVQTDDSTTNVLSPGSGNADLLPALISYNITNGVGTHSTLTLSSGSFTYTPIAGNQWVVSYDYSSTVSEITPLYRILSVNEVDAMQYEVQAVQYYSGKHALIDAYSPIPTNKPGLLTIPPAIPTTGFITHKSNKKDIDLTVSWDVPSGYVTGTQYRVYISKNGVSWTKVVGRTTETTVVLKNKPANRTYYAKVTTLLANGIESQGSLILGPYYAQSLPPVNNFTNFTVANTLADVVELSWDEDPSEEGNFKYEAWGGTNSTLSTSMYSGLISAINTKTKQITITGFDASSIIAGIGTTPANRYRVETELVTYPTLTALNITGYGYSYTTNTTTIYIESSTLPDIAKGDKLYNVTRNATSNVTSVNAIQTAPTTYFTTIAIHPAITSQVAGDRFYTYKGVAGVTLVKNNASASYYPLTFLAQASTSTTVVYGITNQFTGVQAGDVLVNLTRKVSRTVSSATSNTATVAAITGQVAGDTIIIYSLAGTQTAVRQYSALFANTKGFYLNQLYDPSEMPVAGDIIINITRGEAAVITSVSPNGNSPLILHSPSIASQAGGDVITVFKNSNIYQADKTATIRPTASALSAVSGAGNVNITSVGAFASATVGDIVYNTVRRTSSVILTKNSNDNVILQSAIPNQAVNDHIFVIPGAQSLYEKDTYSHPSILTAEASTTATTLNCVGAFTSAQVGWIVYNCTRNLAAAITTKTNNNSVILSGGVTGIPAQAPGDLFYVFANSMSSNPTTTITAVEGAFKGVRPSDIIINYTRSLTSTVDTITEAGLLNNNLDQVVLTNAITGQVAGDHIKVIKGYYSGLCKSFTDSGANDIVKLNNIKTLYIGARVSVIKYNNRRIKVTSDNVVNHTSLSSNTQYYYWMRIADIDNYAIVGAWMPNTTGNTITTAASSAEDYNSSNNSRKTPIVPISVTPINGGITLAQVNADSTANIFLEWEWTGRPAYIDGFLVYFWSSDSASDDATIDANDDYVSADWNLSIPVNPSVNISNITGTTTITVTTTQPHKLTAGTKFRITGVNGMTGVNNLTDTSTDYFTVATAPTTTTLTATASAGGTYTSGGILKSCSYKYQVQNLTANYYYNAWIRPYRVVNTASGSDDGLILGNPIKLY